MVYSFSRPLAAKSVISSSGDAVRETISRIALSGSFSLGPSSPVRVQPGRRAPTARKPGRCGSLRFLRGRRMGWLHEPQMALLRIFWPLKTYPVAKPVGPHSAEEVHLSVTSRQGKGHSVRRPSVLIRKSPKGEFSMQPIGLLPWWPEEVLAPANDHLSKLALAGPV